MSTAPRRIIGLLRMRCKYEPSEVDDSAPTQLRSLESSDHDISLHIFRRPNIDSTLEGLPSVPASVMYPPDIQRRECAFTLTGSHYSAIMIRPLKNLPFREDHCTDLALVRKGGS